MTAEFDYDNTDGPDIDTIRSIAAEMADAGKPTAPTEAERQAHEQFLAQCRERDRLQRLRRAEAAAVAERQARQQAAIAKSERDQRLREQMREQSARQYRDAQIGAIHRASIEQQMFRQQALKAQANANARAKLKSILYPREQAPLPEPTVVYVEPEDDTFCGVKNPRWR